LEGIAVKHVELSCAVGLILILTCQAPAAASIPITPGEYITGNIAEGQSNMYTFQANAGESVTILVAETGSFFFVTQVELYSPSGRLLVTATRSSVSASINAQVLPQTGTYLVIVSDKNGTREGQYGLTVIKNPGPNATDPDGGDTTPGEYKTGTIQIGDLDCFSFQANAGESATILLGTISGALWPQVELHSPSGRQLAIATDFDSATINAQALPQTGTYLVIVRDYLGRQEGQYGLTIIKNPGPNMTDPDGGDVAPGEYKTGTIKAGDLDAFSFQANVGESVTILLGKIDDSFFWPQVELHGPDGRQLAIASDFHSATINAQALPQTGTYLIIVSHYYGNQEGRYGLTVIKNPGPNITDPDGGDMAPGEYKTGTIKAGDLDAFSFWANAGDSATILAENITKQGLYQATVELHGPDGAVVATASINWMGRLAQITAQLLTQTGTYLIIVRDEGGYNEGQYGLTLRLEPPALVETVVFQQAAINDANVTGDLTGSAGFDSLEFVNITTGSFTGQGFSKGMFQADLEGATYTGAWGGALFSRPKEKRIYLKGAISGELLGTVEGYLTESTPESGIYDQYQATWKIRPADSQAISATLNVSGIVSYQSAIECPNTPIFVSQNNFAADADGDYNNVTLGAVVTSLKMVGCDELSTLDGFSTISFTSKSGSGQGWTYDKWTPSGTTQMIGLLTDPFFGVVSGTVQELGSPRFTIYRVDLGLPPMADLEIEISGPDRVSPGQTINYIIEYRNRGLDIADDVLVIIRLPEEAQYISSTNQGTYRWQTHEVFWILGSLPPGEKRDLAVTVEVNWGLPQRTELEVAAIIDTTSPEVDKNASYISLIPIIEDYLTYQYPSPPVEQRYPTADELPNLLQDPQFANLFNDANSQGFEPQDIIVKLIGDDGTVFVSLPMVSVTEQKVLLVCMIKNPNEPYIYFAFDVDENLVAMLGPNQASELLSRNMVDSIRLSGTLDNLTCIEKACWQHCVQKETFNLIVGKWAKKVKLVGPVLSCLWQAISGGFPSACSSSNWKSEDCIREISLKAINCLRGFEDFKSAPIMDVLFWGNSVLTCTANCMNAGGPPTITPPFQIWCVPGREWRSCHVGFGGRYLIIKKCNQDCQWELQSKVDCCPGGYCGADFGDDFPTCITGELPMSACPEKPPNSDSDTGTTATAHDPNRKFGLNGNVLPGQILDYSVEYENEGEGIAFGVYFTDTLDPNLDDSTLKIGPVIDVNSGEQIGGVGTYNAETRTITWFVGQVDPNQGGYADFSINVRDDAPLGTEIINVGTVYFPSVPEETDTNAIISIVTLPSEINQVGKVDFDNLALRALSWLERDFTCAVW
jgi:uncharacterized repeat protein (TIGR01451 family)